MAHISKQILPKNVQAQIEQRLQEYFHYANGGLVFKELLTDIERLMLAKRLATILMLIDEHSYYRIEQVLGVSISTSKRIHKMLLGGAFQDIEHILVHKKERQKFLNDLEVLFRAGLPPRAYVIKKRNRK